MKLAVLYVLYEKFGLVISKVVFPTANIIKDELLYVYYGCCDVCISLATMPVKDLLKKNIIKYKGTTIDSSAIFICI